MSEWMFPDTPHVIVSDVERKQPFGFAKPPVERWTPCGPERRTRTPEMVKWAKKMRKP